MSRQVLIVQPDLKSIQSLSNFFRAQGDQVWHATATAEAYGVLEQTRPGLVVVDLHVLNDGWQDVLHQTRQKSPATQILFTTHYPDPPQELRAQKQYPPCAFLQQPFTRANIEQALQTLAENSRAASKENTDRAALPKVRVPVRMKITLPYIILALMLAMGVAYVVNRVVLDTIEERFTNQLIEAGKLTNDWMVQEENRLLETLRLLAYMQGVPEAVTAADAERLHEVTLPLAVNYQEEAIEILNMQGVSLLSLRHRRGGTIEAYSVSRGESLFAQWEFVRSVLAGRADRQRDKYAGLARPPWGDYFYVAGPILAEDGRQVGVVLVGKSLPTLIDQMRQSTLAHTTIYDLNGHPLASTLLASREDLQPLSVETVSEILQRQDEASLIRPLTAGSINYSEILGPWEARESVEPATGARSHNDQGVIGAALPETFLVRPSQITRLQIYLLTTAALFMVITLGLVLANRITRPLLRVVDASARVAEGDLEVQVNPAGNDEVAVLAYSFNQMVSGLREGSLYRDLLGRTVSPEVREQLRQGFASGDVRLEGQEAMATVLVSNIRGFTTLAETKNPTTVMTWLNEYFDELVPIVVAHGGVISKFEGDAILVFFGILPRLLPAQESAYQGCRAALAMLEAIEKLNARRVARGESAFSVGISLNTGPVTAGALGSTDRIHYTIIGDTVNTTTRLESITQQLGQKSSAVISQHTLFALQDWRHEFQLESLGAHTIRGKVEQLLVYHLQAGRKEMVE
ncbi:MAG: HAMP domain-containing protein [Anaerolineae bacterium]|nr:HAMP domain-containing protein [Anaerolineae bacterium]